MQTCVQMHDVQEENSRNPPCLYIFVFVPAKKVDVYMYM